MTILELIIGWAYTIYTLAGFGTGLVSAGHWLQASNVNMPSPPNRGEVLEAEYFQNLSKSQIEASNLNKIGARWAAATIVLQLAGTLTNFPKYFLPFVNLSSAEASILGLATSILMVGVFGLFLMKDMRKGK